MPSPRRIRAGEHGYREESRLFGEMAMTPVCRELIFLFFATTALEEGHRCRAPESAPARREMSIAIGILGAGFMGAGIASVAVQHGTMVRLKDADLSRVGKGIAAVRDVLKERLTRKQITRQEFADQMLLVGGTIDYSGFDNVDLVIEAVFEDLAVKHEVVREVEAWCPNTRSSRRTRARSRSRGSPRHRAGRSACSGCISSRRCTACRCSR